MAIRFQGQEISRGNQANPNYTTESAGVPRTDLQQVMIHYGINQTMAQKLLNEYNVDDLLPERGSRIGRR